MELHGPVAIFWICVRVIAVVWRQNWGLILGIKRERNGDRVGLG